MVKFGKSEEQDVGLPSEVIKDAVIQTHPPQTAAQQKLSTLFNEIISDYMRSQQDKTNYQQEFAASFITTFSVQQGKEEALAELFDGLAAKKAMTRTPDGREAIYKKAILWGHLMEMAASNDPSLTIEQKAASTFDQAFQADDLFKDKRPVVNFLKEYWAGYTPEIEAFLDAKLQERKDELKTLGALGGVRDPRCKYVDIAEQNRPGTHGKKSR